MTEQTMDTETFIPAQMAMYPWWLVLVWGLLAILVGILFFATPGITTVVFITLLGAFWFVGGIFTLFSLAKDRTNMGWKILLAVLNIIIGAIILVFPLYSTLILLEVFIIFLGIWACIIGGVHLFQAFPAKDAGMAVLGILSFIFGILLLAFPLVSALLLPFVAGAFAIVLGISAVLFSFMAKKKQAAPAS